MQRFDTNADSKRNEGEIYQQIGIGRIGWYFSFPPSHKIRAVLHHKIQNRVSRIKLRTCLVLSR